MQKGIGCSEDGFFFWLQMCEVQRALQRPGNRLRRSRSADRRRATHVSQGDGWWPASRRTSSPQEGDASGEREPSAQLCIWPEVDPGTLEPPRHVEGERPEGPDGEGERSGEAPHGEAAADDQEAWLAAELAGIARRCARR